MKKQERTMKHRKPSGKSGQALIEFCLVLPLALLLLVGTVDFGRYVVAHSEVAALCQDAARYGRQTDPETGEVRSISAIRSRIFSILPTGVLTANVSEPVIEQNVNINGLRATKVYVEYTIPRLLPGVESIVLDGEKLLPSDMKIRGSGAFVRN